MPLPDTRRIHREEVDRHLYSAFGPTNIDEWLAFVAQEYLRLRAEPALPPDDVLLDGIVLLNVEGLRARLRQAGVPRHGRGPLDVVRSDFGETLCYLILREEHGTECVHIGVRDRELAGMPGRGFDVLGVEEGDPLTIVFGEAKVSAEGVSPPQVVDVHERSLRNQHLEHLGNRKATADKVFHVAMRMMDARLQNLLFACALLLEGGPPERLRISSSCVLVRPETAYTNGDFGTFRGRVADYVPAQVRFHVPCFGDNLETVVQRFYELLGQE